MENLRIAVSQINSIVGDLKGNSEKILGCLKRLDKYAPDIVLFPELALVGYPPEDLLLKPHFRSDCRKALKYIIKNNSSTAVVVLGYVQEQGKNVYNSAAIIKGRRLITSYRKINLPNYGVFDEARYFTPGVKPLCLDVNGIKVGVSICEDIWKEYNPSIAESLINIDILLNLSASPYQKSKIQQRIDLLQSISKKFNIDIVYANLIGGQDELVFDGASMIVASRKVRKIAKQFREDDIVHDFVFKKKNNKALSKRIDLIPVIFKNNQKKAKIETKNIRIMNKTEEIYNALLLGTRDYVRKNSFKKVVIGLSGGIDSSLVAVIACDALGCENVLGLAMPSKYSSKDSLSDAEMLARNLGIKIMTIPIKGIHNAYIESLKKVSDGFVSGKTEENIQARIRGNIIMAFSNKFGYLALTTGNKSEVSTGYCTLYGDMAGGFAVIKDVTKTVVYKLAEWRNLKAGKKIIPANVFRKPPSAELKPNQKDQDTLPEYNMLDRIILLYIEKDMSFDEIVKSGYDKDVVKSVIRMIDSNEYKRRQAPPGIKITPKAFGRDRRMPITCGYKV